MAYNNEYGLISVRKSNGEWYKIPLTFLNEKSYKCVMNTLDLDSYRDATGELHRTAVLRTPSAEVTTRELYDSDWEDVMQTLAGCYVVPNERKLYARVYVNELCKYKQGYFYLPDTDTNIDKIEVSTKIVKGKPVEVCRIKNAPVTLKFIGYGKVDDV